MLAEVGDRALAPALWPHPWLEYRGALLMCWPSSPAGPVAGKEVVKWWESSRLVA
jgi:hypothetical protein